MAKKDILVVDDEADVVTYLSAILTDAGYDVRTANNGQAGLDAARAQAPDLVSLDITMPEKSGVRFFREMREDESTRAIPIVVVTGITSPLAGSDGKGTFETFLSSRKELPAPDAYFEKPIDRDVYLARIAELLAD